MTGEQAAAVLEGLAMKYRRLAQQADNDLARVHGEIVQALERALAALEGDAG